MCDVVIGVDARVPGMESCSTCPRTAPTETARADRWTLKADGFPKTRCNRCSATTVVNAIAAARGER